MNYTVSSDGKSITCKRCSLTSYNPSDIKYRYCGKCHVFHDISQEGTMLGPGKYDAECSATMTATNAKGCVLIVINGTNGSGFSAQLDLESMTRMPSVLRDIADQMEEDLNRGGFGVEEPDI